MGSSVTRFNKIHLYVKAYSMYIWILHRPKPEYDDTNIVVNRKERRVFGLFGDTHFTT